MTKPGFVLRRLQLMFSSKDNEHQQLLFYNKYIKRHKNCLLSFDDFKDKLLKGKIQEKKLIKTLI